MTENQMARGHHCINGLEFEQTLGDSGGQGSLVCCSPWGRKESDTTEQLNDNIYGVLWSVRHSVVSDSL